METLQPPYPLMKWIDAHWEGAFGKVAPEFSTLADQVRNELPMLRHIQVDSLLKQMHDSSHTLQLDNIILRPEGVIFNATGTGDEPLMAKVYYGSGITSPDLLPVIELVYPDKRQSVTIFNRRVELPNRFQPVSRARQIATRLEDRHDGYYYASAEILVRTMAHVFLPDQMKRPIAVVDNNGNPVGMALEQTNIAMSMQSLVQEESLFDDFRWLRWADNIPQNAASMIEKLKQINVYVYQETASDLEGQLLFDSQGQFVTFARLGYLR